MIIVNKIQQNANSRCLLALDDHTCTDAYARTCITRMRPSSLPLFSAMLSAILMSYTDVLCYILPDCYGLSP